ncbi:MAG: winged helix-turn-helix transcriptional regulator [Hyphomicrobiales bacterium]|nr:winged helix-turn-helix transcriptional regulator [Hyphomicrobiales bacterium]MCP4997876.1 winged helix-turn-helix transcriptional regulator [Hyphomicrobiales bacterium]
MTPTKDNIDLRILEELQSEGRISMVELADRVGLTKTPCTERVKRLEREGVITGYRAELNQIKMEANHQVMVQVTLAKSTLEDLEKFRVAVERIQEVRACFMIAGHFDFLLLVRTKNVEGYRQIMGDKFYTLPGIQKIDSYVIMEVIKDVKIIPVRRH